MSDVEICLERLWKIPDWQSLYLAGLSVFLFGQDLNSYSVVFHVCVSVSWVNPPSSVTLLLLQFLKLYV